MNPRAVQAERNAGTSGRVVRNVSIDSVDSATQTDEPLADQESRMNAYVPRGQLFDDELLRRGQLLATHHANALSRMDERPFARVPTAEFREIPFVEAFFDPTHIYARVPLQPHPLRPATTDDLINGYLRCFVLFSDWHLHFEEFQSFKYHDRITLAKSRFYLFNYWISSIWTADCEVDAIIYPNGTYFQRGGDPNQTGPQLNLMTDLMNRMLDTVVRELRSLKLNEVERCCLYVVAFFTDVEKLGLAKESVELAAQIRERYIRILHTHVLQQMSAVVESSPADPSFAQHLMRQQSEASVRCSKILLLVSSLMSLVTQSPNEGRLGDSIVARVFSSPPSPMDLKPVQFVSHH
ncbi:Zinc finger and Nuclear hormone receptor domain containing protein [Aphelenchoides fujianensis]|nr:Zinc finger and Nuclear hormone receptor domain containing protein [Aphelenchoides fujianensis]